MVTLFVANSLVALTPERRRRAVGLVVDHMRDVADHRHIEDRVETLALS